MSKDLHHGGEVTVLYSEHDRKRKRSLFAVQLLFMQILAELPPKIHRLLPSSWRGFGIAVARSYCIFMGFQTSHLALLFAKTTFDKFAVGQLDEITDSITMVIIYSFSAFATSYWQVRAKRLEAFVDRIEREYRHHSLAGLTFVSYHRSYDWARKLTITWLFFCVLGVVMWGLAPIILRSRTLPLNCWYPFDPLQPVVYEMIYTLQLLAQINVGATFGNVSALYVSMILVMLGQFDVLYCSLKNFEFHARLLSGEDIVKLREIQKQVPIGVQDELNQYILAQEHKTDLSVLGKFQTSPKVFERHLHDALVKCIQHHRFILECCEEMEELFNPFCLIKSIQITFQLTLLVFVGVAGERSMVRTINLVQYFTLTAIELMMFTYCGELLRGHSVRGGEALWRSEWWSNARHIRKEILIFLVNSRRAVKITAGKFYAMDVERLRSVVTQAFSLMTLLQKLAAKDGK